MVLGCNPIAQAFATTGTDLRREADILREEGKSLKAIDIYNQAIVDYQEKNDYGNMMGALTGRLLSWKHLFYKTQDKVYAIFVRKEAEAMLDVAKLHQLSNTLHLIRFLNGTAAGLLEEYGTAEAEFKKAVELYPLENAEKGDWMSQLGYAMYRNGKKQEGKEMILQGVQVIKERSDQIDSFLFNVWVSGAYLRLAKLLQEDDPAQSRQFLTQAREIIHKDTRLVIRKQQLEMYVSGKEEKNEH